MRRWILMASLLGACSSPPSKGGNLNSTPNNANNTSSNNSTVPLNNNATTNLITVTTAGRNIWASDYDQSCEYDGDCAVVNEGDACLCGGAACGNTSINNFDAEQWYQDREQICPADQQVCSADACEEIVPVCSNGVCDARPATYIDPSGLDTSCEIDEECVVVVGGEVCSSCLCGGTAVNAQAAADYLSMFDSVDCVPGPDFCDCATIDSAWCNDGTCEVGVAP